MNDKHLSCVLLVNQSTGYLMIDIVNAYAEKYSDVVLLTGNLDTLERTLDKSVKVHKIVTYVRTSFFLLLFTHCIHTIACFLHNYNYLCFKKNTFRFFISVL